jgi:hypothetical protein
MFHQISLNCVPSLLSVLFDTPDIGQINVLSKISQLKHQKKSRFSNPIL